MADNLHCVFGIGIGPHIVTCLMASTPQEPPEKSANGARPFRGLLDTSPAMIWSAGPDCRFDYFNQSWLDYRGRTIEMELFRGCNEGVHPEDRDRCQKAREAGFGRLTNFQTEYRLLRHDAVYRWILETAAPCYWPVGVLRGYVGACVDIHERKVAEDALRSSNAALTRQNMELTAFASAASHDLQEPLRTIANYTGLLAARFHLAASDDVATILLDSIRRAQCLVRDLLEYARMADQPDTRLTEVDCNSMLDYVLLACKGAIDDSAAEITRDSLPTVRSDELQLSRVLQNLISNALKYRRPIENPHVHISAEDREGEWLFEVADNGSGFDPRFSEQIFEPFRRLQAGFGGSGSGLGLSICKKIVERQGGHIWAESNPGKGSRFLFTLPRH